MPVKRRRPKARKAVDDDIWRVLMDQEPIGKPPSFTAFLIRSIDHHESREMWELHGTDVVEAFALKYPGQRPTRWWAYEAPELRRRIAGTGVPLNETNTAWTNARNPSTDFHLGVPLRWVTPGWQRILKLRQAAVDPNTPPTFESQAHYLRRLHLLTAAEREALSPADYEPESIFDIGILTSEDPEDDDD
jgi:hypothetical protein